MARFGVENENIGSLRVDDTEREERIRLYFVSTDREQNQLARARIEKKEELLAEVDIEQEILKIYPICTLNHCERFLRSKFQQIHTFTLNIDVRYLPDGSSESEWSNWFYEELPRGFVKDFHYGMGLRKDLNRLIKVIEENTQCDELVFVADDIVRVEGSQFIIGVTIFDEVWGEVDRIGDRGSRASSRVKDVFVHNALAEALGLKYKEYSLGRHPHSSLIAKAADGIEELSDSDQDLLVDTVTTQSSRIAERAPEKLYQLKRNIELVTLDRLIEVYEEALEQDKNESYWQVFFDKNVFALQQIFGVPMVSVHSGAHVGGHELSGSGDRITDYLFKNLLTNNVALVEIKKPTTKLLETSEYRTGLFGPSKELNGAVSQVLDQAYQLTKNFIILKDNARQWDMESYAVSCFVVAGRTPAASDPTKQKSFELYRANSRRVVIVTYDEILEQLKLLRRFLSSHDPSDRSDPEV